jgi:hypothetical protein
VCLASQVARPNNNEDSPSRFAKSSLELFTQIECDLSFGIEGAEQLFAPGIEKNSLDGNCSAVQETNFQFLGLSIACAAAGRASRAKQQGDAPRANSLRLGRVSLSRSPTQHCARVGAHAGD